MSGRIFPTTPFRCVPSASSAGISSKTFAQPPACLTRVAVDGRARPAVFGGPCATGRRRARGRSSTRRARVGRASARLKRDAGSTPAEARVARRAERARRRLSTSARARAQGVRFVLPAPLGRSSASPTAPRFAPHAMDDARRAPVYDARSRAGAERAPDPSLLPSLPLPPDPSLLLRPSPRRPRPHEDDDVARARAGWFRARNRAMHPSWNTREGGQGRF